MSNFLWDEDENDLAVFEFYKKLPTSEQKDSEIFITPEKIFEIQEASEISYQNLRMKMIILRGFEYTVIKQMMIEGKWMDYTIFKRVVSAIKEYYRLRPEVIENHPELLV